MTRSAAVHDAFESRAETWSAKYHAGGPLTDRIAAFVSVAQQQVPAGGKILDLGCGTGVLALALADAGFTVEGCDISEGMIAQAKRVEKEGLSFRHLEPEWTRLPWPDGTFDGVVASSVLEYVPDLGLVFDEVARVLVAGGSFTASVPSIDTPRRRVEKLVRPVARPLHVASKKLGFAKLARFAEFLRISRNNLSVEDWYSLGRRHNLSDSPLANGQAPRLQANLEMLAFLKFGRSAGQEDRKTNSIPLTGLSTEKEFDARIVQPFRVLAVVASDGLGGGIERFVDGTLERARYYCDIEVIAPPKGTSLVGIRQKLKFIRLFQRKVRANRFDHVMVFHEDFLPMVATSRKTRRGFPSVSCFYYGIDIWKSSPIERFIGRRVEHTPITISSFAAGAVTTRLGSIPFILPPPIPAQWFDQLCEIGRLRQTRTDESPLRVASIFRLSAAKQKGAHLLVSAVGSLVEAGLDIELCLAGRGPAPDWLVALVAERHWAQIVESPTDQELAQIYQSSDVMALCSLDGPGRGADVEGFGIVLTEASLSGLAVIGPGFGGATDALIDGVTGLYLSDTTEQCVRKCLRALAEDRGLVASFGAHGHRWVAESFSPEVFSERVRALVGQLSPVAKAQRS